MLKRLMDFFCGKEESRDPFLVIIGREAFICEILSRVVRDASMYNLLELRTVSKDWNSVMREISYIDFSRNLYPNYKKYSVYLNNLFPNVRSITACHPITHILYTPYERIEKLELFSREDVPRGDITLSGWTSLKTLLLCNGFGRVNGIETLTSLTHLECYSNAFQKEVDIYSLCNLTQLQVSGFSMHCDFFRNIPLLIHLESENPHHFIGYSGSGILKTSNFQSNQAKEVFDSYQKDADYLDLNGNWENGLFTGDCFIGIDGDSRYGFMKGCMLRGKLHGMVEKCSFLKDIVRVGLFQNGLKHGVFRKFHVITQTRERVFIEETEWIHGVKVV